MKRNKLSTIIPVTLSVVLSSAMIFSGCGKKEIDKSKEWNVIEEGEDSGFSGGEGVGQFGGQPETEQSGTVTIEEDTGDNVENNGMVVEDIDNTNTSLPPEIAADNASDNENTVVVNEPTNDEPVESTQPVEQNAETQNEQTTEKTTENTGNNTEDQQSGEGGGSQFQDMFGN